PRHRFRKTSPAGANQPHRSAELAGRPHRSVVTRTKMPYGLACQSSPITERWEVNDTLLATEAHGTLRRRRAGPDLLRHVAWQSGQTGESRCIGRLRDRTNHRRRSLRPTCVQKRSAADRQSGPAPRPLPRPADCDQSRPQTLKARLTPRRASRHLRRHSLSREPACLDQSRHFGEDARWWAAEWLLGFSAAESPGPHHPERRSPRWLCSRWFSFPALASLFRPCVSKLWFRRANHPEPLDYLAPIRFVALTP